MSALVYLAVLFPDGRSDLMSLSDWASHDWVNRPDVSSRLVNVEQESEAQRRDWGVPVRIEREVR